MDMSQTGAKGHIEDFQAYNPENNGSFWAARVLWKRQDVKATIIQLIKNEALVIETNQFKATTPPATAPQSVSFQSAGEHTGRRTGHVDICQHNSREACYHQGSYRPASSVDLSDPDRNEPLDRHRPQDPGGQIDRLGRNGEDAEHNTSVQDARHIRDFDALNSQHEWRGGHPTTAQKLIVVRTDENCNENDTCHVDKYHPVRNELGGMAHGETGVLSFSAHDSNENLITDSPTCK